MDDWRGFCWISATRLVIVKIEFTTNIITQETKMVKLLLLLLAFFAAQCLTVIALPAVPICTAVTSSNCVPDGEIGNVTNCACKDPFICFGEEGSRSCQSTCNSNNFFQHQDLLCGSSYPDCKCPKGFKCFFNRHTGRARRLCKSLSGKGR